MNIKKPLQDISTIDSLNRIGLLQILERIRWRNGFCCPRCDHDQGYHIKSRILIQCKRCQMQVSPTSGTALHGVRNLHAWIKTLIVLLGNKGISAFALARRLDQRYATTWEIIQKLRLFLDPKLSKIESHLEVPCQLLKSALYKSSKEYKTDKLEKNSIERIQNQTQDIEPKIETTGQKQELIHKTARDFTTFLKSCFHGVSRKYAQLYTVDHFLAAAQSSLNPSSLLEMILHESLPRKAEALAVYRSPTWVSISAQKILTKN
ncbi:MAG: transposase [Candidatus Obscuribacterales bacterium]|nr:transposase [Candidatus Obscuribacterales bacterium]